MDGDEEVDGEVGAGGWAVMIRWHGDGSSGRVRECTEVNSLVFAMSR